MNSVAHIERCGDRFAELLKKHPLPWICLAAFSLLISHSAADPDLFARVAAGRLVQALGYVTKIDPFSFTPIKPVWIDHEWLSGWIFYQLTQLGGDSALFLFKCAIAFYSILYISRAQKLNSKHASGKFLWLLLAVYNSLYIWSSTVRSQVFTYLFIPYLLFAFAAYLQLHIRRYLVLTPFIMIVWVNAHGGFVLGIFLYALFILQLIWERRKLFLATLLFIFTLLATLINPYGIDYWGFMLEALWMPRPAIEEWSPLFPVQVKDIFFHLTVLCSAFGIWKSAKKIPLYGLITLIMSAFLAYQHLRLKAFFSISAAVFGSHAFDAVLFSAGRLSKRYFLISKRSAALLAAIIVPLLFAHALWFFLKLPSFSLKYSAYPVAALEWLSNSGVGRRVLIDFNNGSYALWRLYPGHLISIDGRYEELYPQATFDLVGKALNPLDPEWHESFSKIGADVVLINSSLKEKMLAKLSDTWRLVYSDDQFSLIAVSDEAKVATAPQAIRPVWEPLF